ncbi:hypothetical protein FFB58_16890 [Enterobacter sp. MF024]|nr:hypothetical protein FHN83_07395 [Leclercia adecarboxylata]TLU65440.1 hypothetical protein FFB58_16890 [Enterobacter sp. MF024]
MPGGAALTGPTKPRHVGRIRRSRHPAIKFRRNCVCYTHLNPYEIAAIIRRNRHYSNQSLPRRV